MRFKTNVANRDDKDAALSPAHAFSLLLHLTGDTPQQRFSRPVL